MISKVFLISATAMLFSGITFADDTSSQPPKPTKQMVNECMTQQMGADSSMSRADARKACKLKVKNAQDPTGTNRVGSGQPDKP